MVEYKGALDVISKTFRPVSWNLILELNIFNTLQTSFSNPCTLKRGTCFARLKQFDEELDQNWRRTEISLFEYWIQFSD